MKDANDLSNGRCASCGQDVAGIDAVPTWLGWYCAACVVQMAKATRRAEYCAARLCDDCAETEPCAYTSASECAMARERMVASVSDEIPAWRRTMRRLGQPILARYQTKKG